ncbi:hypothetical protein [Microtetraspora malaysiensis]|uniref:hypothetical protein n=1 Tax=Microtetraspora malaysiensis TaxID=161358 RepID=UPI003D8FBF52
MMELNSLKQLPVVARLKQQYAPGDCTLPGEWLRVSMDSMTITGVEEHPCQIVR